MAAPMPSLSVAGLGALAAGGVAGVSPRPGTVSRRTNDVAGELFDVLEKDLRELCNSARQRHPRIKEAAERAILKLKMMERHRISSPRPHSPSPAAEEGNFVDADVLKPFMLAVDSRQLKLITQALTIVQKIVARRAIHPVQAVPTLVAGLRSLVDTADENLHIRVIQTLLSLVSVYCTGGSEPAPGPQLWGAPLGQCISLLMYLLAHRSATRTVRTSAASTLRQLVDLLFTAAEADAHRHPTPPDTAAPTERPLTPAMADVAALFADLCALVNGDTGPGGGSGLKWLAEGTICFRFLSLELIEGALRGHHALFSLSPPFRLLLKQRLCPPLLKVFSIVRRDTTVAIWLLNILIVLVTEYDTIEELRMEREIFISMVTKTLDVDQPLWLQVLGLQALKTFFSRPELVATLFQGYDLQPKTPDVVQVFVSSVCHFIELQVSAARGVASALAWLGGDHSVLRGPQKQAGGSLLRLVRPKGGAVVGVAAQAGPSAVPPSSSSADVATAAAAAAPPAGWGLFGSIFGGGASAAAGTTGKGAAGGTATVVPGIGEKSKERAGADTVTLPDGLPLALALDCLFVFIAALDALLRGQTSLPATPPPWIPSSHQTGINVRWRLEPFPASPSPQAAAPLVRSIVAATWPSIVPALGTLLGADHGDRVFLWCLQVPYCTHLGLCAAVGETTPRDALITFLCNVVTLPPPSPVAPSPPTAAPAAAEPTPPTAAGGGDAGSGTSAQPPAQQRLLLTEKMLMVYSSLLAVALPLGAHIQDAWPLLLDAFERLHTHITVRQQRILARRTANDKATTSHQKKEPQPTSDAEVTITSVSERAFPSVLLEGVELPDVVCQLEHRLQELFLASDSLSDQALRQLLLGIVSVSHNCLRRASESPTPSPSMAKGLYADAPITPLRGAASAEPSATAGPQAASPSAPTHPPLAPSVFVLLRAPASVAENEVPIALLTLVVRRNTPRLPLIWPVVADHLVSLATEQTSKRVRVLAMDALLEVIVGAVESAEGDFQARLLAPLISLAQTSSGVDTTADALSAVSLVVQAAGGLLSSGWVPLLALLKSLPPPQTELTVLNAFRCVELICGEFLPSLPPDLLPLVVETIGAYTVQRSSTKVALSALALFFTLSDGLPPTDPLWLDIFAQIQRAATRDPRLDVRHGACRTLYQTLQIHGVNSSPELLGPALASVVVPLCSSLLTSAASASPSAPAPTTDVGTPSGARVPLALHHSLDSQRKQWAATASLALDGACLLIRRFLRQLTPLPLFRDQTWPAFIALLLRGATAPSSSPDDVVLATGALTSLRDLLRGPGAAAAEAGLVEGGGLAGAPASPAPAAVAAGDEEFVTRAVWGVIREVPLAWPRDDSGVPVSPPDKVVKTYLALVGDFVMWQTQRGGLSSSDDDFTALLRALGTTAAAVAASRPTTRPGATAAGVPTTVLTQYSLLKTLAFSEVKAASDSSPLRLEACFAELENALCRALGFNGRDFQATDSAPAARSILVSAGSTTAFDALAPRPIDVAHTLAVLGDLLAYFSRLPAPTLVLCSTDLLFSLQLVALQQGRHRQQSVDVPVSLLPAAVQALLDAVPLVMSALPVVPQSESRRARLWTELVSVLEALLVPESLALASRAALATHTSRPAPPSATPAAASQTLSPSSAHAIPGIKRAAPLVPTLGTFAVAASASPSSSHPSAPLIHLVTDTILPAAVTTDAPDAVQDHLVQLLVTGANSGHAAAAAVAAAAMPSSRRVVSGGGSLGGAVVHNSPGGSAAGHSSLLASTQNTMAQAFSRECVTALFRLAGGTGSATGGGDASPTAQAAAVRLARMALPPLQTQALGVLTAYAAEERDAGLRPVSRQRLAETVELLQQLAILRVPPQVYDDLSAAPSALAATESGVGHLRVLFPALVECVGTREKEVTSLLKTVLHLFGGTIL